MNNNILLIYKVETTRVMTHTLMGFYRYNTIERCGGFAKINTIELLDGAMGSEFITRGISLSPYIWSAQLNLDAPEIIYKIHKEYIDAGSDYITTNTFRTTPRAYKKLGLSDNESEILAKSSLKSAVNQAKKVIKDDIKILGSIAPLEDCYKPELFPGVDVAKIEFLKISQWLYDSKIDIFLLETMNSIDETITCLEVVKNHDIPIWISFVLLDEKRILSGELLKDAIKEVGNFDVDVLLLNCNPINRTKTALKILSNNWDKRWGIYPNLGIGEPNPDGIINYIYSDEEFMDLIKYSISLGATILGGCCGSSPKHIQLIKTYLLKHQ